MSTEIFDKIETNFPKTQEALDNAFANCQKRKQFIPTRKENFKSHLELAKADLASLERDFKSQDWRWTIVKSYYAIFHATNALLIQKLGFFSKDHVCAILILHRNKLLDAHLFTELKLIYEKFSDIFGFALMYEARKVSQYDAFQWRLLTENDANLAKSFAKRFVSYVEVKCNEK